MPLVTAREIANRARETVAQGGVPKAERIAAKKNYNLRRRRGAL
jgi:hypothetical protein